MMHDFAVSLHHSIILDLPLTMNPLNIVLAQPMLHFNRGLKSRFGILPRYFQGTEQNQVKWFESDEPSLIFHTADAWDEGLSGRQYNCTADSEDVLVAVNMYCCRFRTSKLVFAAGGMRAPDYEEKLSRELSDVVRLTFMRFSMSDADLLKQADPITHAFSLSAIPFDFPVVSHGHSMREHRYVYGCTLREGQFDSALEGAKIDCIVKMNAQSLREKGMQLSAEGKLARFDDVDKRSVQDILETQRRGVIDEDIQIFDLPKGIHGQEPVFVPKADAQSEDDGYLIFYAYDEAQLCANGDAPDDSSSQLYIIDAARMAAADSSDAIVAVIDLPSRVPYGLHSSFITAEQIASQLRVQNPSAELIEQNLSTPVEYDLAKPRLRRATVTLADNSERLEVDLIRQSAKETDLTLWMWCASLFWLLLQRMGILTTRNSSTRCSGSFESKKLRTPSRPSIHRIPSHRLQTS